jgi:hypothetical protein
MKCIKYWLIFFFALSFFFEANSQQNWKLTKENNGIKVYMASSKQSKFKSIRVQCVFDGTIPKLINIIKNVSKHTDWVYKTKEAYVLKQVSPSEFIYYSESIMPWPISNRDGTFDLSLSYDTANNVLRINAFAEPNFIAIKAGLVRIPYSKASWYVTEFKNQLTIDYIFEVDPGGSIPAWLVNLFADDGPYESFQKLARLLKS